MLCSKCQAKQAKILYTEIVGGIKKEQHLCEDCSKNFTSFQMAKPNMNKEFTLGDLLSTVIGNYYGGDGPAVMPDLPQLQCRSCHTTYEEFIKRGQFGCALCYREFGEEVDKTLKSIHGSDIHRGKRPKGFESTTPDILARLTEEEQLTIKLEEAIKNEEYEEAAKIRDEIRELKKEAEKDA